MSINTHKNQIQSLSSLSLEHNLKNLTDSQMFPRQNRKSSFDLVNLGLNESQPNGVFQRSKLQKSLQRLSSSFNINNMGCSPLQDFLQFNGEDMHKFSRAGIQPSLIDQIDSQSDREEQEGPVTDMKIEEEEEEAENNYTLVEYLPEDLAKLLQQKQIPLQYVRGLLLVNQKKQIKSIRRLKVERYLQKRRKKTWDKKICYNCRQKVAQQRLRIKGKFIKKRRAMQILGLSTPISTVEIKQLLQEMLKDKTLKQIEQIIRKDEPE